jgi:hypothetical protein
LLDPFVEFPEVVDEPYGTILLGNDELWSSPLQSINLLEYSYFHQLLNLHLEGFHVTFWNREMVKHGKELLLPSALAWWGLGSTCPRFHQTSHWICLVDQTAFIAVDAQGETELNRPFWDQ